MANLIQWKLHNYNLVQFEYHSWLDISIYRDEVDSVATWLKKKKKKSRK